MLGASIGSRGENPDKDLGGKAEEDESEEADRNREGDASSSPKPWEREMTGSQSGVHTHTKRIGDECGSSAGRLTVWDSSG
jgi:hypothetical protein